MIHLMFSIIIINLHTERSMKTQSQVRDFAKKKNSNLFLDLGDNMRLLKNT